MHSVLDVLDRSFAAETPDDRRPTAVITGTIDLKRVNTAGMLINYRAAAECCYRLSLGRETTLSGSSVGSRDGIPRLPLRMHLLITAWHELVEHVHDWLDLGRIDDPWSRSTATATLISPGKVMR